MELQRAPFHKESSQAQVDSTSLPEIGTAEESIPLSIVPYNRDDDRARYLGLRSSGFSIREALGLLGKHKSTLSKWRLDSKFLSLEQNIQELRKTLAIEYAGLEFLRNFRLVLEKDFRVLKGSLARKTEITDEGRVYTVPQDAQDFQYLLKLRGHYTPQQLQAIEQLFGKQGDNTKEFNWTDVVMTLSRTNSTTKEEVKIETRRSSPSNFATIEEHPEYNEEPEIALADKSDEVRSDETSDIQIQSSIQT